MIFLLYKNMYNKQQLIVTSITALGVWLNLTNNYFNREFKKDARRTRSDSDRK